MGDSDAVESKSFKVNQAENQPLASLCHRGNRVRVCFGRLEGVLESHVNKPKTRFPLFYG
jgi:hypothetical protein